MANTIKIDPRKLPIPWTTSSNYRVAMTEGLVAQVGGVQYKSPAISSVSTVTTYSEGPTLSNVSPAAGTTSSTSSIFLTYNRPITASTGTEKYYLYKVVPGGTDELVHTIASTSTRITRQSNKVIKMNVIGLLLPNTSYYMIADAGAQRDMFRFPAPAINDTAIISWSTIDGPTITGKTPSYNLQNSFVTSSTITYSKVISKNTGNFYFNEQSLGVVRTIPVNSSSVTLIGTNTVKISLYQEPIAEGDYYITYDQDVLRDQDNLPVLAVTDDTVIKFQEKTITNMVAQTYQAGTSTFIFNAELPTVLDEDFNTSTQYTLKLSSSLGKFTSTNATLTGISSGTYWISTGTRNQITEVLRNEIYFIPTLGSDRNPSGFYTYSLEKNGFTLVNKTLSLTGDLFVLGGGGIGNANTTTNQPATISLTVSSPRVIDEAITLTANIASSNTLSGVIQFRDYDTVIATAPLSGAGQASAVVTFASTGTKSISAYWAGGVIPNGNNYLPLTSTSTVILVERARELGGVITMTASSATVTPVIPVTFTATFSTSTVLNSGSITFVRRDYAGGPATTIGTGTITANQASVTSTITEGTFLVTAEWPGTTTVPKYYEKSSNTLTETILPRSAFDTSVSISPNPFIYRDEVGSTVKTYVTATINLTNFQHTQDTRRPSGIIGLYDGVNLLGTGTLTSTALTATTTITWIPPQGQFDTGARSLSLSYAGDNWNLPATVTTAQVPALSFTSKLRNTSTIVITQATGSPIRPDNIVFTATTNKSTMDGRTVVWYEGSTVIGSTVFSGTTTTLTLNSLNVSLGTHSNIQARFSADTNFESTTSNRLTYSLAKRSHTMTLYTVGQTTLPYAYTVNVSSSAGSYMNGKTVKIYRNNILIASPTFNSSGIASITVETTTYGESTNAWSAVFTEDTAILGATSNTVTVVVTKTTLTSGISFTPSTLRYYNPDRTTNNNITATITISGFREGYAPTGNIILEDITTSTVALGQTTASNSSVSIGWQPNSKGQTQFPYLQANGTPNNPNRVFKRRLTTDPYYTMAESTASYVLRTQAVMPSPGVVLSVSTQTAWDLGSFVLTATKPDYAINRVGSSQTGVGYQWGRFDFIDTDVGFLGNYHISSIENSGSVTVSPVLYSRNPYVTTVNYSGDEYYESTTSNIVSKTIRPKATISLSIDTPQGFIKRDRYGNNNVNATITVRATGFDPAYPPSGLVTFKNTLSQTLVTGYLNTSGVLTTNWQPNNIPDALNYFVDSNRNQPSYQLEYPITATMATDPYNYASTSPQMRYWLFNREYIGKGEIRLLANGRTATGFGTGASTVTGTNISHLTGTATSYITATWANSVIGIERISETILENGNFVSTKQIGTASWVVGNQTLTVTPSTNGYFTSTIATSTSTYPPVTTYRITSTFTSTFVDMDPLTLSVFKVKSSGKTQIYNYIPTGGTGANDKLRGYVAPFHWVAGGYLTPPGGSGGESQWLTSTSTDYTSIFGTTNKNLIFDIFEIDDPGTYNQIGSTITSVTFSFDKALSIQYAYFTFAEPKQTQIVFIPPGQPGTNENGFVIYFVPPAPAGSQIYNGRSLGVKVRYEGDANFSPSIDRYGFITPYIDPDTGYLVSAWRSNEPYAGAWLGANPPINFVE